MHHKPNRVSTPMYHFLNYPKTHFRILISSFARVSDFEPQMNRGRWEWHTVNERQHRDERITTHRSISKWWLWVIFDFAFVACLWCSWLRPCCCGARRIVVVVLRWSVKTSPRWDEKGRWSFDTCRVFFRWRVPENIRVCLVSIFSTRACYGIVLLWKCGFSVLCIEGWRILWKWSWLNVYWIDGIIESCRSWVVESEWKVSSFAGLKVECYRSVDWRVVFGLIFVRILVGIVEDWKRERNFLLSWGSFFLWEFVNSWSILLRSIGGYMEVMENSVRGG